MSGVRASLNVDVIGSYLGANDLGTPEMALSSQFHTSFTEGTTAGKADKMFSDTRTLAASGTEDLDLAGSLVDPLGAAVTFAKVKAIIVRANAANVNNVIVGGAASNGFVGPFGASTDTIAVRPGGVVAIIAPQAGWTVTPSTADLLHIANSGGTTGVTYDIFIIGTSA